MYNSNFNEFYFSLSYQFIKLFVNQAAVIMIQLLKYLLVKGILSEKKGFCNLCLFATL